ncbi:MAG: hypothetical protein JOZ21_05950 [Verrucomicrobia bacterium]|nr:hypothetical protein [Verrucomicrobiota bacterium]
MIFDSSLALEHESQGQTHYADHARATARIFSKISVPQERDPLRPESPDQILQPRAVRCGRDFIVRILVVRPKFDPHQPGTNQFSEAEGTDW